jgi:hypothetical protein
MTFVESELFHDKSRYLTVYEKHVVNFIGKKSSWHLIKDHFSLYEKEKNILPIIEDG